MVPLNHFLLLSGLLFAIGTAGVFLRRNLITVLLSSRRSAVVFEEEAVSSVAAIGRLLFTDYAFPFEVTSVLILVAMVGAVVLARKEH